MLMFTLSLWVKIQYLCNARVAGLGKIFVHILPRAYRRNPQYISLRALLALDIVHCYSILHVHYGVNGMSTCLHTHTPASLTVLLDVSAAEGSLVSATT